jgi:hypothetical protein
VNSLVVSYTACLDFVFRTADACLRRCGMHAENAFEIEGMTAILFLVRDEGVRAIRQRTRGNYAMDRLFGSAPARVFA